METPKRIMVSGFTPNTQYAIHKIEMALEDPKNFVTEEHKAAADRSIREMLGSWDGQEYGDPEGFRNQTMAEKGGNFFIRAVKTANRKDSAGNAAIWAAAGDCGFSQGEIDAIVSEVTKRFAVADVTLSLTGNQSPRR